MSYVDYPEFYWSIPKQVSLVDVIRHRATWPQYRTWRRYRAYVLDEERKRQRGRESAEWQEQWRREYFVKHGRWTGRPLI